MCLSCLSRLKESKEVFVSVLAVDVGVVHAVLLLHGHPHLVQRLHLLQ